MSAPISITEDALVDGIGQFIQGIVGTGVEIVRGQQNRVASPTGHHVYINPLRGVGLALPSVEYDDAPGAGTMSLRRPTEWTAQLDFYGESAQNLALAVAIAWRSSYACDALRPHSAQPLFCTEPRQLPFISGESQYIERWTFDAVLQFNPKISLPQQFADRLHVGLVEVDTTYPPGA